jgi:hypothetical protein
MIFSRWQPDTGGYDYYDSPSTRIGLGDDLPVPRFKTMRALGLDIGCSTDIGRDLPADATKVGSGPLPRGMVSSMAKVGQMGLGAIDFTSAAAKTVLCVVVALGIGFFLGRDKR